MGSRRDCMRDRTFTTAEIARMLELNPTTINKYVDERILRAFRTPGGHRRVMESDLMDFLKDYAIPVPLELTSRRRGLRVQIIDDDAEFTKNLREELVAFSPEVSVHCNDSGYTGLLDISIFKPDLLILDYVMPHLDGAEFMECFRNHDQFKSTEVVVVTGYPDPEIEARVMALGARAFFMKPLDMDAFITFFRGTYEVRIDGGSSHRAQAV
jgi:excisionase family DNA binding protein